MTNEEYMEFTRTVASYDQSVAVDYLIHGLTSEAGEVAGKRKKELRDGTYNQGAFLNEVGDCLWYITRICDEWGITLEDLMVMNKDKLQSRKDRGTLGGSGDDR